MRKPSSPGFGYGQPAIPSVYSISGPSVGDFERPILQPRERGRSMDHELHRLDRRSLEGMSPDNIDWIYRIATDSLANHQKQVAYWTGVIAMLDGRGKRDGDQSPAPDRAPATSAMAPGHNLYGATPVEMNPVSDERCRTGDERVDDDGEIIDSPELLNHLVNPTMNRPVFARRKCATAPSSISTPDGNSDGFSPSNSSVAKPAKPSVFRNRPQSRIAMANVLAEAALKISARKPVPSTITSSCLDSPLSIRNAAGGECDIAKPITKCGVSPGAESVRDESFEFESDETLDQPQFDNGTDRFDDRSQSMSGDRQEQSDPCRQCDCGAFRANPFKDGQCINCFHHHG